MEEFMTDLLARAAGEKTVDEPYQLTCDYISGMVADEIIRRDPSSQLQEMPHSPSTTAEDATIEIQSSRDYPSYMSLYSTSGYSSSPSYIRGDFYSLTPPGSPECVSGSADDQMKSKRSLSFSIDTIIGSDSVSEARAEADVPAEVYSSFYSGSDYVTNLFSHVGESQDNVSTGSELSLYWCHVCEDICSDYVDACMHQTIHRDNSDQCRLPKSVFKQTGYVTTHETIPGYNEKVKCGLCEKIVTYRLLKVHLQSHEGDVCEICSHEFKSLGRLRDHVKSQHGDVLNICNVCNEHFSDRRELNVHSRQHELCLYQCHVCFRSFRSRHAQRVHQRTHDGSKPHVCVVPGCYKSFSQMLYLQLHLNLHRDNDGYLY